MKSAEAAGTPSSEQVREAMDKIMISRGFANAERMRRFLRFTVEQTLDGNAEQLKEYAIGTEVFDRPADFDPRVDSIVRVEARRLRSKLKNYYASEEKAAPIHITFPPGSYIPVFTCEDPPAASRRTIAVSSDGRPAIAVLPFAGNPESEIFADGLTDELIHALSRLDQLRVVGRTSVFRYKNKPADIREVGRELNVATILEGSVRCAQSRIRVTAQLVDVSNGYELWTEQYDRELTDIFAIQEELAAAIARVLRVRLSTAGMRIVPIDAYQFYLEGLFYSSRLTPVNLHRGIECFTRALVIDSGFAAAHAGLAGCYSQLMLFGNHRPTDLVPLARAAVQEALSLDPTSVEALSWHGFIQAAYDWDWPAAERSFLRVLDLSPSHAEARYWYGAAVLIPLNRLDEAEAQFLEALRLDPASLASNAALGLYHYFKRDFEAAMAQFRRTSELDPMFYGGGRMLSASLLQVGEFEEAIAVLEKLLPIAGQDPRIKAMLGLVLGFTGRESEAMSVAKELEREAQHRYISAFDLALPQIGLAYADLALDHLDRAVGERATWLAMIAVDPLFDELRDKPRFSAIVNRVLQKSLPEHHP